MEYEYQLGQMTLKAKFDAWSDYTSISELPNNFLEVVKIFSTLLYPNNFSINYIDSNMIIHNINTEQKYSEALIDCIQNKKSDLKLMINIYKHTTVEKSLPRRNTFIKQSDVILEESQSDRSETENISESESCKKKKDRSKDGVVVCF